MGRLIILRWIDELTCEIWSPDWIPTFLGDSDTTGALTLLGDKDNDNVCSVDTKCRMLSVQLDKPVFRVSGPTTTLRYIYLIYFPLACSHMESRPHIKLFFSSCLSQWACVPTKWSNSSTYLPGQHFRFFSPTNCFKLEPLNLQTIRKVHKLRNILHYIFTLSKRIKCPSVTLWFGLVWFGDMRRLQWIGRTAERPSVPEPALPPRPALETRMRKRAGKILSDPAYPGNQLLDLLPSFRTLSAITSRHGSSFFPQAIFPMDN